MNTLLAHSVISPLTLHSRKRIWLRRLQKSSSIGLCAFLLSVPFCGKATESVQSTTREIRLDTQTPSLQKHTDADEPVARVDGEPVLVRDVLRRLSAQHPQIHRKRPEKALWQKWVREALEGEILDRLLLRKAKADGIEVAEDMIQASIARSKELMGEEAYQEMLKKRGDSEQEYRQFLRDRLRIAHYKANLFRGVEVQEEEIKEYYERHREVFRLPERFQLRFMILEDQKVADEVMQRLNDGESFEVIANTATVTFHSGADGRKRWMSLQHVPDSLQAHLDDAEEGETLGPIPGEDGFYVGQLLGKKAAEEMDLAAANPHIRSKLLAEKRIQVLKRWFEAERKNRNVEFLTHSRSPNKAG